MFMYGKDQSGKERACPIRAVTWGSASRGYSICHNNSETAIPHVKMYQIIISNLQNILIFIMILKDYLLAYFFLFLF